MNIMLVWERKSVVLCVEVLLAFIMFLCELSCRGMITEDEAVRIAAKSLRIYCQVEGYDCLKTGPDPNSICFKAKNPRALGCVIGEPGHFDVRQQIWIFDYVYVGNPRHEFSLVIDVYGGVEYSGDLPPRHFRRINGQQ